jgi:hypothetical protein
MVTGHSGLMALPRRDSSSEPEPRIMRYELSGYEWTAIKPMLPTNGVVFGV